MVNNSTAHKWMVRTAAALGICAGALPLSGCLETDGWLWDPSVTGRWEHTPTVVPVLDRIDIIEADSDEFVETTEVEPDDLLPEANDYLLSAGDFLTITVFQFGAGGSDGFFELTVDDRGFINIPRVPPIYAENRTTLDLAEQIATAIRDQGINVSQDGVTVQVPGRQQATFSISGAVQQTARFPIPFPDYRLMDALADAGGVSPTIPFVYVIRQVDLRDRSIDTPDPIQQTTPTQERPRPSNTGDAGTSIDDLINELTAPENAVDKSWISQSATDSGSSSVRDLPLAAMLDADQPATTEPVERRSQPAIDLGDDPVFATPAQESLSLPADASSAAAQDATIALPGRWVFLDGSWQRVLPRSTADVGLPEGDDPLNDADGVYVTQRVIKVPLRPLIQGVARYNLVVRPGDIISVPTPQLGVVYLTGPGISRPGAYNLTGNTQLTLLRAIASAGGFTAIAIPERVDITRMVGSDRQATLRLNVRAIFEGTAPDIVLKPDDMVNFGTSFWATPLAVIRGGFRSSYGFGFLLDRNFGNDVFGPPPTNVGNN